MRLTFNSIKKSFLDDLSILYPNEESGAIFKLCIEEIFKDAYINISLNNSFSEYTKEISRLVEIKERLLNNVPVQHILGKSFFYDLEFKVNADVLIPRQETELLVDLLIRRSKKYHEPTILDIGTGSGCIAISLKKNIPQSSIYALDVSKKALSVAKMNAVNNDTDVLFIEGDILKWENLGPKASYDIIVSNPPYVCESEKDEMSTNVKDFDPELALFVKDTAPFIFYQEICAFSREHLNNNGILAFEINERFGIEILSLVKASGLQNGKIIKDLNGKDRIVIAEKL